MEFNSKLNRAVKSVRHNELMKSRFNDEISSLELSPQRESLVDKMGGEETAKIVDSIVRASKR